MSLKHHLLPAIAITGGSLTVGACNNGSYGGCGYGSYGSSCAAPPQGVDPSGIYQGTLTDPASNQSTPVIAIIAENGDALMSGEDGTYYRLNVGTAGNQMSGSYYGYSASPNFPNGQNNTSGNVSANVTPQSSIVGTLIDSASNVENLKLVYDQVYQSGASLATLAGTWTSSTSTFSFSAVISANGTFTATDSAGCSYSGAFDIIDPSGDAYGASFVRTCNGVEANFSGLASYFPSTGSGTSAHIELLADDNSGDDIAVDMQ